MTKYIHTLLLLFVSTFAFAQVDTTLCSHIEEDPRYATLLEERRICIEKEDSLRTLLDDVRERYTQLRSEGKSAAEVKNLSSQILNLEQEVLDIRARQRGVVSGIANLEQRYIVNQLNGGGAVSCDGVTTAKTGSVEHPQLINNAIIARSLGGSVYADLKQAQHEDELMPRLVEEYSATYKSMCCYAKEYAEAKMEREGDALYDSYIAMRHKADSLGGVIDRYWNHILTSKYYAYGYILECEGKYDLLDNSSADFSNMRQMCADSDGKYLSDALAHYALGRSTLVAFERDFATEMGLKMAADSLQRVYDSMQLPEYKLEPITLELRLFVEYEPLSFSAKNQYNDSNPIPELPVYNRGTIYRIALGSFRKAQSGSVFKNAKPLYVTKDNVYFYYYAAGYATEEEAEMAVEQLEAKGLKDLHICCWTDGTMSTLDDDKSDDTKSETSPASGKRYTLQLDCSEMIDAMRSLITKVAPEQRITRGSQGFAVTGFLSRKSAEKLQQALSDSFPNVKSTIIELNNR